MDSTHEALGSGQALRAMAWLAHTAPSSTRTIGDHRPQMALDGFKVPSPPETEGPEPERVPALRVLEPGVDHRTRPRPRGARAGRRRAPRAGGRAPSVCARRSARGRLVPPGARRRRSGGVPAGSLLGLVPGGRAIGAVAFRGDQRGGRHGNCPHEATGSTEPGLAVTERSRPPGACSTSLAGTARRLPGKDRRGSGPRTRSSERCSCSGAPFPGAPAPSTRSTRRIRILSP